MIDALELPKTGLEAPANRLVIGLAQIDCTVGDIAGNLARMRAARAEAAAFGADLVMFSELFIAGYPPEDLVLKPAFVRLAALPARQSRRHQRRRTCDSRWPAVGREWPLLQRLCPARQRPHRGHPLQG